MQTPLPQLIEDLYQVIAEPSQWRRMLDTLAAQLNIDLLIVSVHPAAPVASRCLPGGGRDTKRLTETQITSVADALLSVSRGVREPTQPGEYLVSVPVAALLRKYNQTHSLTTLARADFSYVEHAWLGKHADMQLCLTMLSRVPAEHQELGDEAEQLANRTQRSVAVRTLAPHLARCLRVGIDNGTLNAVRMYGMLAIKNATFGVFHIRASGELGLINPYGHDLASGNGLTIIDRQLHATDEEIDEELQSLISATLNGQLRSATSLRVNRREGEFPLVLTISALPELDRLAMDPPAAILLVTDPTLTVPPDTLPLQRIFGMTRAEAGVARSIMAGKSIEECAEENGHSVATSRNLLKRAFQKTGTHRQSELSALLQCAFLKLDIQRLHRS